MIRYILIACIGLFLVGSTFSQKDEVLIPLDGGDAPKKLKVNIFQGDITVTAGDRKDVSVSYEVIDSKEEGDEDELSTDHQGLKKISGGNLDLEMSSVDNVVSIRSQSWSKNIHLQIKVPKQMDINIQKNTGGSVIVEQVSGIVNIENNVGDVIAKDISGIVNASTNAGKLKIHFAQIPEPKNMMFTSTTGSVDVTFPPQFDVDLILKTDMGEIYSDLDLTIENKVQSPANEKEDGVFRYSHRDHTYAKVGSGGPEITIISKIGSIYLRQSK